MGQELHTGIGGIVLMQIGKIPTLPYLMSFGVGVWQEGNN